MQKILKKSISILIILSFLINIGDVSVKAMRVSDVAISSKLSISKDFTQSQMKIILEKIKSQIQEYGQHSSLKIHETKRGVKLTFFYSGFRRKTVFVTLRQEEEEEADRENLFENDIGLKSKYRGIKDIIKLQLNRTGRRYLRIRIEKTKEFSMPRIEGNWFYITKKTLKILYLVQSLFSNKHAERLIIAMIKREELRMKNISDDRIDKEKSQIGLNNFKRVHLPVIMKLQNIKLRTIEDLVFEDDNYISFWMNVEKNLELLSERSKKTRQYVLKYFPGLRDIFLEISVMGLNEPIITSRTQRIVRKQINSKIRTKWQANGSVRRTSQNILEKHIVETTTYLNGIKVIRKIIQSYSKETGYTYRLADVSVNMDNKIQTIEFSNGEKLVYRMNRLREAAVYLMKDETIKLSGQIGSKIRDILVPVDGEPLDISHQRPLLQSL